MQLSICSSVVVGSICILCNISGWIAYYIGGEYIIAVLQYYGDFLHGNAWNYVFENTRECHNFWNTSKLYSYPIRITLYKHDAGCISAGVWTCKLINFKSLSKADHLQVNTMVYSVVCTHVSSMQADSVQVQQCALAVGHNYKHINSQTEDSDSLSVLVWGKFLLIEYGQFAIKAWQPKICSEPTSCRTAKAMFLLWPKQQSLVAKARCVRTRLCRVWYL